MTSPTKNPYSRFMTHVAVGPDVRNDIVDRLNVVLATSVDLYTQVKQAHWNIKGPQFVSRHMLFDELADHIRGWTDTLAERISGLGGYANGTARQIVTATALAEYNLAAVAGKAHIQALVIAYGAYTSMVRGQLLEVDDPVTEDLLTEVLRDAEQDMWFLESHLNV